MADKLCELIIVMGVSGSGKSTIAAALADSLAVAFIDADDLHPASNITKMASGMPLDDADRWPWLRLVGRALESRSATGAVVACSCLKRSYRDAIRAQAPTVRFVLLTGEREVLARRVSARLDHFMPPALLDSQLKTLEPLGADEDGFAVDIDTTPEEVLAFTLVRLNDQANPC